MLKEGPGLGMWPALPQAERGESSLLEPEESARPCQRLGLSPGPGILDEAASPPEP